MPIPHTSTLRFTPKGLADGFDATEIFPGACRKLQNLVFDQSNPEVVIARPGVGAAITSFAGFTTPGFVSLQVVVGTKVFGMVATGLTAAHDEPFCYDLVTNAFIAISGVTAGNAEGRPTSPATTGAWTPPTLAVIGAKIIITHPGYAGTAGKFFGVIDISNPAAPAYTTANTTTNLLPTVPTSVANFNNRAYFACGNVEYYSDVLAPTVMTTAGQSLTLGDNTPIVAQAGLPVTTTSGGVVGALIVFKGTQIWQITGDAAVTGTLAQNYLTLTVGCQAPRSVVSSPLGTFFAGPDCAYFVSATGLILPVTNQQGGLPDIRQPFNYCTEPTRVAAAFASNIYRLCIPTIVDGVAGTFDYWFDCRRFRWNGPHTFLYDCASGAGNYFVLTDRRVPAKLFTSYVNPKTTTIYTDNAAVYTADMVSATMPKRGEMAVKQIVESTMELSSSGAALTYGITAFGENGQFINAVGIPVQGLGHIWGTHPWGNGLRWTSSQTQVVTYRINWSIPIVFNKIAIEVSTPATKGVSIGTFYGRTQTTGYTLQ